MNKENFAGHIHVHAILKHMLMLSSNLAIIMHTDYLHSCISFLPHFFSLFEFLGGMEQELGEGLY